MYRSKELFRIGELFSIQDPRGVCVRFLAPVENDRVPGVVGVLRFLVFVEVAVEPEEGV